MKQVISRGHYYRKQLECSSQIIAWSHRSRFETALKLVGGGQHLKLLDYGCGDGSFVEMVAPKFSKVVGADIDVSQIQDCQQRCSTIPSQAKGTDIQFCSTQELQARRWDEAFDVVVCMETLEHCLQPDQVLQEIHRACKSSGRVVISVPIETGLTFLLKLAIRKLAAWRGLSDYRYYESYSLLNALKMIFAGDKTSIHRPAYGSGELRFHSHYGFNWRYCKSQVESYFTIEQIRFSPLNFLGGIVSSQVWLICSPRYTSCEKSRA